MPYQTTKPKSPVYKLAINSSMRSARPNLQFAQFTLDQERRRIQRDGVEIALRPKTFAVLMHLVENRRRAVSRAELMDEVWHGRLIEPQGVFQSISELRTAFGQADFIRTVRGFGYQWVVPTRECAPPQGPTLPRSFRGWAWAAVGLVAGVCVTWFTYQEDFLADLEVRLDLAYARFEQGDSIQGDRLARETYERATGPQARHLRLASAVLLSRSPLINATKAEYYAREAIDIGRRIHSPDFEAAGHERLGELLVDRGEPELAIVHWSIALESYTDICPSSVERVRGLLAGLGLQ